MSRAFQETYQRRFVEEQLPAAWRAGHKSVLPELAHLDPRVLLAAAEPKLATASDTRKADLLVNLWAKEIRAKGTIEAVNYKRVAAIYKGMTGSWPTSEALSAAKRAALDKLGKVKPDSS